MDENLDHAISAAGLVLAVLAALYTLWLPSVTAALGIKPDPDKENRGGQRSAVLSAILTKALPLAVATTAASAILFRRFYNIAVDVARYHGEWRYNDIKALFALTYLLLVVLTVVAVVQLLRLILRRCQLG